MPALLLLAALVVPASVVYAINWLSLIPWRRNRTGHWTEQARLSYPARKGAAMNLWTVPASMAIASVVLPVYEMPPWWLVGLFAFIGTLLGSAPMGLELFPRLKTPNLLRHTVIGWSMRLIIWGVLIAAAANMPEQLDGDAAIIFGAVLLFLIFWSYDGWIRFGKAIKWIEPADKKLQTLVDDVSRQTGIAVRSVWVIRSEMAQAYAFPGKKMILFTTRALAILNPDEIRSVIAHELAHLSEGPGIILLRHASWLSWLPWILVKPLVNYNQGMIFLLAVLTYGIPQIMMRVSRWLERRADKAAKQTETETGVYARSLLALYQDNLVPAVLSKAKTHPDLYDRMLAAGITPDFPRPKAAENLGANGYLMWFAFIAMLVIWGGHFLQ